MPSLTLPCAPPLCGGAGVRERKLCSSLSSHSAQPRLAPLGRQRAHLVSRRHAATVEVSTGPEQEDEEEDEPYPVPSAEDAVHGLGQATATVAGRHLRERMWYSESDPAPTYQVAVVDAEGVVTHESIQRREILKMTGLQARELRLIDPLTAASAEKVLTAVRGVVLISLAGLRVIVQASRAFVFRPRTELSSIFLEGLSARLTYENSVEIAESGHVQLPFELEVVEAALLEATWQLEQRLAGLGPRVQALYDMQKRRGAKAITNEMLEELRAVKQSLVDLTNSSTSVESLLMELLDDDEALESISQWQQGTKSSRAKQEGNGAGKGKGEVDTATDLLLFYCSRAENVRSESERFLENTKNLEVSINVTLNARRYELNKLELLLAVASFAVGVGGMWAGIFGMNFLNGGEQSKLAFYSAMTLICAGVVAVFHRLARYMDQKALI